MAYPNQYPRYGGGGGRGRGRTQPHMTALPVQPQVFHAPAPMARQQTQVLQTGMYGQPTLYMPGQPLMQYAAQGIPAAQRQQQQAQLLFQQQQLQMMQQQSFQQQFAVRAELPNRQGTGNYKPAQTYQQPQPITGQQTVQQPAPAKKSKALLIVDPDSNKPVDLSNIGASKASSKSPQPTPTTSVVSPTTESKKVEFLTVIGQLASQQSTPVSSKPVSPMEKDAPESFDDDSKINGKSDMPTIPLATESLASLATDRLQSDQPRREDNVPPSGSAEVGGPVEKGKLEDERSEEGQAVASEPTASEEPVTGQEPKSEETERKGEDEVIKDINLPEPSDGQHSEMPTETSALEVNEAYIKEPVPHVKEDNVQEPAPVEKEARPAPVGKEARPAPVEKEARPVPLEEARPVPLEEARPAPVEKETRPAPVEKEARPAPVEKETRPAPVEKEARPAPVEKEARPAPVEKEARPAPVEKEARPAPVEKETRPAPVEKEARPAPVEKEARPAPVEKEARPAPVDLPAAEPSSDSLDLQASDEGLQEPASTKSSVTLESVDSEDGQVESSEDWIEKTVPDVKTDELTVEDQDGSVNGDGPSQEDLSQEDDDMEEGEIRSEEEARSEEGEDEVKIEEGSRSEEEETQGGRKKYDREYLLKFRDVAACKEPPPELLSTDLLGILRRGGSYTERRDAFGMNYSASRRDGGKMGRGVSGGKSSNRGGKESQRKVIQQPVHSELKKSENAWKRPEEVLKDLPEEEKETQDLYRKFQAILNKLTPQKFQNLAEQAKELSNKMTTEARMMGCIEKIFLKALEEPVFSVAYAKLCLTLAPCKVQVGVTEDGNPKLKSFRALLLNKCQEEFEKDKKEDDELEGLKKAIGESKTDDERKQRQAEYTHAEYKSRHRSLGNIRFIGELFKLKLLSEAIMHECIQRLLKSTSDEESLECFAKLMSTIGKELDHDKGKTWMSKYFLRVDQVIEGRKVGSRVRFMLQDLVEQKQNNWELRKTATANMPTTIDKIHAEQKKKDEERALTSHSHTSSRAGVGQRGGDQRRTKGPADDRRHAQPPAPVDPSRINRLLMPKDGRDVKQKLGPSLGPSWQKGKGPEPSKPDSTKYGGRGSKGKKSGGLAPPAGNRRSSSQPADPKKDQQDLLATVAKKTGGQIPEKDSTPVVAVSDALSEEAVEKKSEAIIAELCSSNDFQEAQTCVLELRSPGKLNRFVYVGLNYGLEKSSVFRKHIGTLFGKLLTNEVISVDVFIKGLNEILKFSDDLECDIPRLWDYFSEFLAPVVSCQGLPLVELTKAPSALLECGKIGKLVAKAFHKCLSVEGLGHDQLSSIWASSGLDWTTHLHIPKEDVTALLKDNDILFLNSSAKPTNGHSSRHSSEHSLIDIRVWERDLEEQLASTTVTSEDIIAQINKQHLSYSKSEDFILALSVALTRASISGKGDSAIFNNDNFKRRLKVLREVVGDSLALQFKVLCGIHTVVKDKQYPANTLGDMFHCLHDDDPEVISEDVFYQWEKSQQEEGNGVALLQTQNFFEWMKSAEEEDEEGGN